MATSVCRGRGFSRVQNLHVAEVLAEVTRPFTQPWDFGDVTFIVQRKRIYVNKAVLMMSSEVFNAMFTADFAEKKMTEIPLPDKKFDDFLELMKIVHPQTLKRLDESNIESLLPLAHEYQMHHVVENCEKYLLDQPPSIHNLILADKFSLSKLRIACVKYVKEIPYSKLKKDPEFEILGQDTLLEVFQYKLWECKDPSKGVIFELLSQPPSVKNLLLAEEHDVPEAYERCLQYLKDTPLKLIKNETGFTNVEPTTLVEVLKFKVEHLEALTAEAHPLKTKLYLIILGAVLGIFLCYHFYWRNLQCYGYRHW